MPALSDVLAANEEYAERFAPSAPDGRPRRALAIVTCMDARLDPAAFAGLAEGDAHVIRNAGGIVTDDVLRSLAISHHLLGTREALVIGHTDCGLAKYTDEEVRARVGEAAADVDFLTFADLEERVRASVRAVLASPLLPADFAASGLVYDVGTGRLRSV